MKATGRTGDLNKPASGALRREARLPTRRLACERAGVATRGLLQYQYWDEKCEILNTWQKDILKEAVFQSQRGLMSVSQSPICPKPGTNGRVASEKASAKDANLNDMIEHDIVVRMPPKRRYLVEVDVTDIRKAKPKIVAPDSI